MSLASTAARRSLLAWSIALLSLSCERGRSTTPELLTTPVAPAAKRVAARKAEAPPPPEIPGPVVPHGSLHDQPQRPGVNVKFSGKIGEQLEGNVYKFRLVSLKKCGPAPGQAASAPDPSNPKARIAVGAEVEIAALDEMHVSPRDVSLSVGGVAFNGSVDRQRKLLGCEPLLRIAPMRAKEVERGFAIFDIPVTGPGSNLAEMVLSYRPTRFGGAGLVRVAPLMDEGSKTASR